MKKKCKKLKKYSFLRKKESPYNLVDNPEDEKTETAKR